MDGYRGGYEQGQQVGLIEGRLFGGEKGFELWTELGYYKGVISVFKHALESQLSTKLHEVHELESVDLKAKKQWQQLASLEALWNQIPQQNDSNNAAANEICHDDEDAFDLGKLLERVRARYRLICKTLGFSPQQASGCFSENPDSTQSQEQPQLSRPSQSNLVRIAGQLVDPNQLNY